MVGIKPSTGRVARIDDLPIILHDFEIIGPLARTVDDLAMTLAAIEGPDPRDRLSHGFAPGALSAVDRLLRTYPGRHSHYAFPYLGHDEEDGPEIGDRAGLGRWLAAA